MSYVLARDTDGVRVLTLSRPETMYALTLAQFTGEYPMSPWSSVIAALR
jgi:hypothetical protein